MDKGDFCLIGIFWATKTDPIKPESTVVVLFKIKGIIHFAAKAQGMVAQSGGESMGNV